MLIKDFGLGTVLSGRHLQNIKKIGLLIMPTNM